MTRVPLRLQALGVLALASALSSSAEARRLEGTSVGALTVAMDGYPQPRGPRPEAVLIEMNRERGRRGLPALSMSRSLNAAAEDRLQDMFEQGYFAHDAPDGTSPFVALPGHRANILGRFEDAGVAIALGSPTGGGRGYTFVALYARPRS